MHLNESMISTSDVLNLSKYIEQLTVELARTQKSTNLSNINHTNSQPFHPW